VADGRCEQLRQAELESNQTGTVKCDVAAPGGAVMKFENNFVYPFSWTMFDPILKIRVALTRDKEMHRAEDGIITIYSNQNITSDNLVAPKTEEELEFARRFHAPGAPLVTVKPLTEGERKFDDIYYDWEVSQNNIRLNIGGLTSRYPYLVRGANVLRPDIDSSISDLYFYIIKNYIFLPTLREYCFPITRYPDVQKIEICVTENDLLNFFKVDRNNYPQVETGLFCIASRALDK
jgi:hypothetical protein